jgi:hypothetical protein
MMTIIIGSNDFMEHDQIAYIMVNWFEYKMNLSKENFKEYIEVSNCHAQHIPNSINNYIQKRRHCEVWT